MTLKELYQNGKNELQKAGVDAPAFDAICLFEAVFGQGRSFLVLHGDEPAGERKTEYYKLIEKRCSGEPLQYLLGQWDFLSLQLYVDREVLIPRPETELLCETAAEALKKSGGMKILDLCAGTGAVGLGICSLYPKAQADCVEWYDSPLACLKKNLARYPALQVSALRADVLSGNPFDEASYDGLVSNPPYIASGELSSLQREVQQEPREALDGGEDGLIFYRAILKNWSSAVKKGGFIAFEIGEDQGEQVSALMKARGFANIRVLKDFQNNDRVVFGEIK